MNDFRDRESGDTRRTLLMAALRLFGEDGFEATTTRRIAAAAGANIGSISYYFGGKDGLHAACVDFIVETMRGVVGAAFDLDAPESETGFTAEEARERLNRLSGVMLAFLAERPEAEVIAPFMLREITHPASALDRIYAEVIEPVHKRLCRVWSDAAGTAHDDPETLLSVFAMIGQVVYFRLAREIVTRRMGWKSFGRDEAQAVIGVLTRNLDAAIDMAAERRGGS